MQVKKFEAKNMREALELVKSTLGPDAIIVAAKDNQRSYGLGGQSSVEVTAAVSEYALKKKEMVEGRLTDRDRERLARRPARDQKEFINRIADRRVGPKIKHDLIEKPSNTKAPVRGITRTPYVDIQDDAGNYEAQFVPMGQGRSVQQMLEELAQQSANAAARSVEPSRSVIPAQSAELHNARNEVSVLRTEISALKQIIEDFQKVPQKFVSVHPGAEHGLPYELSFIFEKMRTMGIDLETICELLMEAQKQIPYIQLKKRTVVEGWVAKQILDLIRVSDNPFAGTTHVFLGANGQGKSSTLIKMAAHLVVEKKRRVAIVTTDTFKIGAIDQMRIFAQILNVPFAIVRHQTDWNKILSQFSHVDHILVDMPGLQLKSPTEIEIVKQLMPSAALAPQKHLVVSAAIKDAEAREVVGRFNILQPNDLIFTCVDETVQYGIIFNLQKYSQLPLHSFGIGAQVPEDWELATRERLVDLLFKLTKLKER